MTVTYVDTSALAKLVVPEPESAAFRSWIASAGGDVVTSTLTGVELRRAARRHTDDAMRAAEEILDEVDQLIMTPAVLREAGRLEPPTLRSLDAIHLATALRIESSLSAFVAYDERLCAAAEDAGLPVVQPR